MGTPAAGNTPGAREGALSWTDAAGSLWLFGGMGYAGAHGYLHDLWKYDPTSGCWTWMKGSFLGNQSGVFGTLGTPGAANTPGGCAYAVSWTDLSGCLWLFGGYGYAADGGAGYLGALWKYEPPTGNWTWMNGSSINNQRGTYGTLGTPAPGNTPGARVRMVSWTGASGALWLFGG